MKLSATISKGNFSAKITADVYIENDRTEPVTPAGPIALPVEGPPGRQRWRGQFYLPDAIFEVDPGEYYEFVADDGRRGQIVVAQVTSTGMVEFRGHGLLK